MRHGQHFPMAINSCDDVSMWRQIKAKIIAQLINIREHEASRSLWRTLNSIIESDTRCTINHSLILASFSSLSLSPPSSTFRRAAKCSIKFHLWLVDESCKGLFNYLFLLFHRRSEAEDSLLMERKNNFNRLISWEKTFLPTPRQLFCCCWKFEWLQKSERDGNKKNFSNSYWLSWKFAIKEFSIWLILFKFSLQLRIVIKRISLPNYAISW